MAGSISRGTLPQNFLDSVSTGLMLPTPQPQFWFAKMAMAGRLSLAALDAGAPTVQQFVSIAGGGAPVSPELDEMARAADAYPGLITAVDAFGKDKGDTVKFTRLVLEGSGYTKAARQLNTDNVISTTGQNIKTEEVPSVLYEYHGPMAANGSAPQPYAIWDFDAQFRKNKLQLAGLVTKNLRYDYIKWLDTVVRDEFLRSTNVTLPLGIANAAAFVAGGGVGISLSQIFDARKALSDREWQKFSNGRYMCLVPTSFNTQMMPDPDYRDMSKFHTDKNMLYNYIGSVQDIDFFEITTLKSYAAGDSIAGSTVGSSVGLDECLLLGPGCVGFGTALPCEARWADDTNYGTVAKVIWYAIHALDMLDNRGVQRIVYQTA